jgi:exosortase E/protease (VPEID-CTERM system)
VACGVLLAEYLILSLRMDAASLTQRGGSWRVFASVGLLPAFGIVVVTGALMARGGELAPAQPVAARSRAGFLVGHALLYGAFYATSAIVFGEAPPPPGCTFALPVGWAVIGAASACTLFVALVGVQGVVRGLTMLLPWVPLGLVASVFALTSRALWASMSDATLKVVVAELRLVAPGVTSIPTESVIALRDFDVAIAPQCSGIEGAVLILALVGGYLVTMRRALVFPQALLLLPIGVFAALAANTLRISAIVLLGAYVDADLACGAFHSKAGWVVFSAIALTLAALARRVPALGARAPEPGALTENPVAPYLMPILAMIATAMITGLFAVGADPLYGVRVVAGGLALWIYRASYQALPRGVSLVALMVGAAVGAGWVLTDRHGGSQGPLPVPSLLWIASHVAGSVALVPACEELAFRGYVLPRMVSRDFEAVTPRVWTPFAILGSSLAFGLVHERWVAGTLAGLAFALVQRRTGRLADAVATHATANAVVALHVLVARDWGGWS